MPGLLTLKLPLRTLLLEQPSVHGGRRAGSRRWPRPTQAQLGVLVEEELVGGQEVGHFLFQLPDTTLQLKILLLQHRYLDLEMGNALPTVLAADRLKQVFISST